MENKNVRVTRIATGIPMGTDIEYIEFSNINGKDTSVQTIKKSTEVSSTIHTPEYITVAQTLDEESFKMNGTVKLTPNIVINTIL